MARIEKEHVDLDYDATREFFRGRGERGRELGRVNATAYQDQDPELAMRRDSAEKARVLPQLEFSPGLRILDLGCGTGRWADELGQDAGAYLGIDYVAELLELARERFGTEDPKVRFQVLSVTELGDSKLATPPPFDRILISGLCIYLNDADLEKMLAAIPALAAAGARLYLREPISLLDHRLTLKGHYSEDLGAEYHAIYRTEAELRGLLETTLSAAGFREVACGALYPPELNNRVETRQHFFVLARSGA